MGQPIPEARLFGLLISDRWAGLSTFTRNALRRARRVACRQQSRARFDSQVHRGTPKCRTTIKRTSTRAVRGWAHLSHRVPAVAGDAPHPAAPSFIGVLDVPRGTPPRPSGRNRRWSRHHADIATRPGEMSGGGPLDPDPLDQSESKEVRTGTLRAAHIR